MRARTRRARRSWSRSGALFVLAMSMGTTGVVAQGVPASAIGLGYPVMPIDGRSAALGATGLGLMGSTFSLANPADMMQHINPGFGISFHAEGADLDSGDEVFSTGRQRFNFIRAVAPWSDWAVGIAFGGAFDQDWAVRFRDTLLLPDGTVPFEETREHDGGISTIDLSAARRVGPLSVGVTAQRWIGSLRQTFNRSFDPPTGDAPSLGPAGGTQTLSYKGWRFRPGVSFEVNRRLMLSGAVSLGSKLTATPDGEEELGEVDLPATFSFGASARPVANLLIAGNYGWGTWSDIGQVGETQAHDVRWFGAGLEYEGLSLLGGRFPLRVGIRSADLPFSEDAEPIEEQAITTGFGWIFRQGVAEVNVGFDFGSRGDLQLNGSEESFRRMTVSFALRQFPRF